MTICRYDVFNYFAQFKIISNNNRRDRHRQIIIGQLSKTTAIIPTYIFFILSLYLYMYITKKNLTCFSIIMMKTIKKKIHLIIKHHCFIFVYNNNNEIDIKFFVY